MRPCTQSARLFSSAPPSCIEPFRPSLRRTHRTHRCCHHTTGSEMKPSTILTIILTALLTGIQASITLADSPGASTTDSQALQVMTSALKQKNGPGRSSAPEDFSQGKAPDCEGTVPSNGVVTALLSRIVRSPSIAPGKQCPIPPVPDHRLSQELHE
jgi:hypothetical protein